MTRGGPTVPHPSRYVVHYTVTTHHELVVEVPEGLRPLTIAPSAAMDAVRRMDPLELRRQPAIGTTSYVTKASPMPEPGEPAH